MSSEQIAGDTGPSDPSTEMGAAIGEGAGATTGALAGTATAVATPARSPPDPAPDGNKGRNRRGVVTRRRRRHSFDGALRSTARRPRSRPGGSGSGSGCFATAAEQRKRSTSCSSISASGGSVVVSALATARPGDDAAAAAAAGGGGGGGGGRAKTFVKTPSPSRQEWGGMVDRREAPTVADDGVAAEAPAESCGRGSTAADLAVADTGGDAGEVAADEGSKTTTGGNGNAEASGNKRQLPLPLEPLAGRCWFEDCGKISSFRCRRCRLAFYCGRDHQRGDWARHRGSCEEGRGEPPPPLARLALPPQRQKSVGWADSTTPRSTDGGGGGGGGGVRDGGGGGGGVASAAFRKNKSRLEAAMASAHSKAAAATADDGGTFDPDQVRTARGGTSWTVPASSTGGSGAGSAAVWPASSSSAGGAGVGGGGGGGGGGGAGVRQRGGIAPQIPPSGSPPRPPGPPPPAKIPPPASRPLLDKLPKTAPAPGPGHDSAEVCMLTEMGFDRARAVQALQTCGGSVERAAEWLLTGFGGGGGVGGDGDGVAHGPHLPGAGGGGQDGDGGGRGWLGGGTELEAVGKTVSGGGGDNNDDDDDLITTADASDVGQGLDMRDFWSSERAGGGGGGGDGGWAAGGGDDGGSFGKPVWGSRAGGAGMAAVEEDDDEDFVTCYEDTVGGVQADVVIFFRSADAAGATAPAAGQGGGEEAGGEQGKESVLTVVVRPLPSTAPASVDSGSSRGGAEYDRYDTANDVEHALYLPWPKAEDLARRHETAQALRAASSTAVAAAAAAVGIGSDELAGPGGGGGWRQGAGGGGRIFGDDLPPPLSPSSPLRPTSRSYDDGAGGAPSWARKKKVGELIVGIMERRLDGGYDIFAPEVDRCSRLHAGGLSQDDVVARTYERPRGRSLPKWDGGAKVAVRGPPPPPPPPPATASTWGLMGSGLTKQHKQPWNCQVCTFFNEDPAFRSACEMCSTPRPSTAAVLRAGEQQHQQQQGGWEDDDLRRGETRDAASSAAAGASEGIGTESAAASSSSVPPRIEPAIPSGGEVHAGGGMGDGSGSDDDGAVDGILGGLSPRGGASPTASAAGVPAVPYDAVREGTAGGDGGGSGAGIDWERGAEWEGVGNASFGDDDSPPVVGSPRHTAFGFPLGGGGVRGGDDDGDGGRGSEGKAP